MKLKDLELLRRNALAPARVVLDANITLGLATGRALEPNRDRPAVLDPQLATAVSVARADLIAERAGLSTRLRERLAKEGVGFSKLDTRRIDQLVEDKVLPKSRAKAFKQANATWQLVDANDALFEALPSTDPEDLTALDREQWQALLKDVESPLETKAHAAYLERKTANWFPDQAISARLKPEEHPAAQVAVGLAGDVLDGLALHQAGYASPRRVARAKPKVLAAATGLTQDRIQSIQKTAQRHRSR